MSSWLFNSANAGSSSTSTTTEPLNFDAALDAITSELLPTPSISSSSSPDAVTAMDSEFERILDMSDLIRSGSVKAADAVRAFRRRLAVKNASVQLRTLLTLDTCIKNSGDAFLKEVAGTSSSSSVVSSYLTGTTSKSLVDELGELIRTTTNPDVKSTCLRLLQTWALAFQSKSHLSISEMVLMYTRLKQEGVGFPPVSAQATSAMIDSLAAPSWIPNEDSNLCSRCRDAFTLTNRRHHCRNCGQLFDGKCSANTMPLPHFGITAPVRVCDGCFKKIKSGRRETLSSPPTVASRNSSMTPRSARTKEDEDLQLALRLSLQESSSSSGYRPSYEAPPPIRSRAAEDDDPDLAAAIAASLRDMEAAPSAPPPMASGYSDSSAASQPEIPIMPNLELSARDTDRLLSFAQATRFSNGQTTVNDLAPLYEAAEASRRELVRSVKDAAGKEQMLMETREKMKEIMRLYEGLLDKQVASHVPSHPYAYGQPQQYAPQQQQPYQQQQPQQSSLYPQLGNAYPSQPVADTAYRPETSYSYHPQQSMSDHRQPELNRSHSQMQQTQYEPATYQHYEQPTNYAEPYPQQGYAQRATSISSPAATPMDAPSAPTAPYEPQPTSPQSQYQQQLHQAPAQDPHELQRKVSARMAQANQLRNLPHAPAQEPYNVSFPEAPYNDLPLPEQHQRKEPEAVLIDL